MLVLAAATAGLGLAATASSASAACTAPATDASGGKCQITFTSSGTFTVPAGVTAVDYVVVAGGGGGSGGALTLNNQLGLQASGVNALVALGFGGGGGGGGSVATAAGFAVTPGTDVAVTVGAGGAGGNGTAMDTTLDGAAGQASSFGSVTAAGGLGGTLEGVGGASGTFTGGANGNAFGGANGGGGAGAGANGGNAGPQTGLAGGIGGAGVDVSSTFPGLTPSVFGGGGGGLGGTDGGGAGGTGGGGVGIGSPAAVAKTAVAGPGTANTGGGGGGGYAAAATPGGAGGSGVVIVRYAAAPTLSAKVLITRKSVLTGQATTLSIRTTNTGTGGATGVISCMTIPANVIVTRAPGATRKGRVVCFNVGDLAAGATSTKSVLARGVTLRTVIRSVKGAVTATGVDPTAATPASVTIRPRAPRPVVTG